MKDFTAVQNTEAIKGMKYSFKAKDLQHAIERAPKLLNGDITEVYEIDDLGNRLNVVVKTALTNGGVRKVGSIDMYDNEKFSGVFCSFTDFINYFTPTIESEKLINKIKEQWNKANGKVTFKPKGYKANQNFYFNV